MGIEMIDIICYLAPACLAQIVWDKLHKRESSLKSILSYATFLCLINLIIYLVLQYGFDNELAIISLATANCGFVVKYLLLALFIACVLPTIAYTIALNVKIELDIKKQSSEPKTILKKSGK